MSAFIAGLHFVALGLGFAGVLLRGIRMREARMGAPLKNIFLADNLWGLAALLWIATGLLRAFGGYEKGTTYYMHNHWFFAKMGLFVMLLVLELTNRCELFLVLAIPFFAALMARGGLILPHQ